MPKHESKKRALKMTALTAAVLSCNIATADPISFETGWKIFTNESGVYKDFRIHSGKTSSGQTGPSQGANGTTNYVYMETSSGAAYTSGDQASLVSSNVTSTHVSFYYHMYGANIGTLTLQKYENGGWVSLWTKTGQQHSSESDEWSKATVKLSNSSQSNRIRFLATAAGSYRGDIAFDEVEFLNISQPSSSFTYDALGRLVEVEKISSGLTTYEYDDAGNRTLVSSGEGQQETNEAPVATADHVVITSAATARVVNLTSNDTDPDGDALTISSINNSDGRFTVTKTSDSSVQIAVGAAFSDFTSGFYYTISDGNGNSHTGNVTLNYVYLDGNNF